MVLCVNWHAGCKNIYIPDLVSVTKREELKERTVFCYGAHTDTSIFFPCLSPVRLPDLRGGVWLCDRVILETNLGVFAALGMKVQTARSDTK